MINRYATQSRQAASVERVPGRRNKAVSVGVILDAAESLFSEYGFENVSSRRISAHAGVSLGLLTHHFATKDLLIDAVMERRAAPLNMARSAAFENLPDAPDLEQVIDAFARPILELMTSGDPGWRAYGRLLARTLQEACWAPLLDKHFGRIGQEALDRIMMAEPRLQTVTAQRAFTYTISILMSTFEIDGLLDVVSSGAVSSQDLEAAYPSMLAFIVGGFRTLARSDTVKE